MALIYLVTFRLKQNRTYQDRYDKLVSAIADVAAGYKTWEEPTSCVVLGSKYEIDPVAEHLKKAIDPNVDVILILKTDYKDARVVGTVEDDDIFALIPYAKKM